MEHPGHHERASCYTSQFLSTQYIGVGNFYSYLLKKNKTKIFKPNHLILKKILAGQERFE
jgi:hypothetical protein